MSVLRRWIVRLTDIVRQDRRERELSAEMESHLHLHTDENVRAGMNVRAARRAALIRLGGVESVKEQCREQRGLPVLEHLLQDIRYALRSLWRQPGFAAVALVTLALGIGANSAIFSVVHAVLLSPLPYGDPDRLVQVVDLSYKGEFLAIQQRSRTLEVAAHGFDAQVTLTGFDEPIRVDATQASANLFDVLGRSALVGRTFAPDEDRPGADPVAILSHAFWRRQFDADPAIVSRQITLDGAAHIVIGVMPADFRVPWTASDVWVPLMIDPADRVTLWSTGAPMIGRLRPGATLELARNEIRSFVPSLRASFPWQMGDTYGATASVRALKEYVVGPVRAMLMTLAAAVGLVLIMAGANVANLLLVRGAARRTELGIRTALGAGRGRLVRQLLTEAAVLTVLGGALGLLLAAVGVEFFGAWLPADIPRADEIRVDGVVIGFTLGLSLMTGLVFGMVPAVRAFRTGAGASAVVRNSSDGTRDRRRLADVLVATQVAVAVLLVVGAALLAASFRYLVRVDPGFQPEQLISADVAPPVFRYRDDPSRRVFFDRVIERLAALPDVRGVGVADRVPFSGANYGSVFVVEGRPHPGVQGGEWPWADIRAVISPNYLRTLSVPIVQGRGFTDIDLDGAELVVLVSETLARSTWDADDPVGQRIRFPGDETPWRTVVGVVADIRWNSLRGEQPSALYIPLAQGGTGPMSVLVRVTSEASPAVANLRSIVRSLDPDATVGVRAVDGLIADSVAQPRVAVGLTGAFAVLGIVLGGVGIYGVLALTVTQRRREIGIRMALGATGVRVVRLVLQQGLTFVFVGVGGGLLAAAILMPLASSQFYGVTAWDPVTFTGVALFFVGVAVVASCVPARRAIRVDPQVALRNE